MADIPAREITTGEALAYGKQEIKAPAGMNARQKENIQTANELGKLQQEGRTPEDIYGTNIGRDEFSQDDSEVLIANLGGGEAKVDHGRATIDRSKASREAITNYDRAQSSIKKMEDALSYTKIVREAARVGKTPDQIYSQPPYNMDLYAWQKMGDRVADALLSEGGIEARFSQELQGLTSLNEKRAFVLAAVGSDYDLNKIIVDKMARLSARSKELPSIHKTAERGQLEADHVRLEKELTNSVDSVIQRLGLTAGSPLETNIKAAVNSQLSLGSSSEDIQNTIYQELLKDKGIDNEDLLREYSAQSTEAEEQEAIIALNDELAKPLRGQKLNNYDSRLLSGYEAAINKAKAQLPKSEAKYKRALQELGIADENDADRLARDLKAIDARVFGSQHETGRPAGGIGGAVDRMVAKQREVNENDRQRTASDSTPEAANERASRIAEEKKIISEIEGVLFDSVTQLVTDRHAELKRVENVRIEKAIEEAKKRGDKWSEEKLKTLKEAQKKRGIELDTKTKKNVVHRDEIMEDTRTLAQKGEDGAKELFAKYVGYNQNEAAEKGSITSELFGAARNYSTLSAVEKSNVDQTYEARKGKFDELYNANSEAFKTRILKDFFVARGVADRLGIGKMKLSNDEWKLLNENFGNIVSVGLSGSKDANDAMRKLRESGINVPPDSPLKWILWALLGIVGAAGISAAAGAARGIR